MTLLQQNELETVQVVTQASVSASVIWLHGLGASGEDFLSLIPELNLPDELGIRFIFPHAPIRPVTLNRGMKMRAWYDVTSLVRIEHDEIGIAQSTQQVQELIQQQIKLGISLERIFLVGFSQGGAIALHAGLNYPKPLGGILGLSTYLPAPDKIILNPHLQTKVPITLFHGCYDEIIPIGLAKLGCEFLNQRGCSVEWREYTMGHEICLSEITDIRAWLLKTCS